MERECGSGTTIHGEAHFLLFNVGFIRQDVTSCEIVHVHAHGSTMDYLESKYINLTIHISLQKESLFN
jgi:hypothetical protein